MFVVGWNLALTPAIALGSVPKVAASADATGRTFGVVQTLPALARPSVAGSRVRHVDVIVALARLAASGRLGGVTIITWSTHPASVP